MAADDAEEYVQRQNTIALQAQRVTRNSPPVGFGGWLLRSPAAGPVQRAHSCALPPPSHAFCRWRAASLLMHGMVVMVVVAVAGSREGVVPAAQEQVQWSTRRRWRGTRRWPARATSPSLPPPQLPPSPGSSQLPCSPPPAALTAGGEGTAATRRGLYWCGTSRREALPPSGGGGGGGAGKGE